MQQTGSHNTLGVLACAVVSRGSSMVYYTGFVTHIDRANGMVRLFVTEIRDASGKKLPEQIKYQKDFPDYLVQSAQISHTIISWYDDPETFKTAHALWRIHFPESSWHEFLLKLIAVGTWHEEDLKQIPG